MGLSYNEKADTTPSTDEKFLELEEETEKLERAQLF